MGEEVARIWLFDIAALFIVDLTKFIFDHNSAGIIDEAAIHAEDAAMQKPAEEDQPVVEFEKTVAKHRESVRLMADQVSIRDKKKSATKSMVFLAEGKTRQSRTSFRTVQSKSVRVAGSKSVKLGGNLHKMTPGTFARQSSGVLG